MQTIIFNVTVDCVCVPVQTWPLFFRRSKNSLASLLHTLYATHTQIHLSRCWPLGERLTNTASYLLSAARTLRKGCITCGAQNNLRIIQSFHSAVCTTSDSVRLLLASGRSLATARVRPSALKWQRWSNLRWESLSTVKVLRQNFRLTKKIDFILKFLDMLGLLNEKNW